MGEQRWTYTFTLTVPGDVEAGDAATEVVRVLDDYLVEDYPEWKVGDLELVTHRMHNRQHSSDDMTGLRELEHVIAPVAVVVRPDGSLDVYGDVGIVDQRS